MKFGRWDEPRGTESVGQATAYYDELTGRPSETTRHYVGVGESWDQSFMRWGASKGRVQLIAPHAYGTGKTAIPWRDVAAGKYDMQWEQHAKELLSYDGMAWLIWHHEPENEVDGHTIGSDDIKGTCGSIADYKAAGMRFRNVVRAAGVGPDRAVFGQCLMAPTLVKGWSEWKLPFRILAVDGYNRYPFDGTQSRSFERLFEAANQAATNDAKDLVIEETGCVENPNDPQAKARWFNEAAALDWPRLTGVEYSNVDGAKGGNVLRFRVDTSPQALSAFKGWAASA